MVGGHRLAQLVHKREDISILKDPKLKTIKERKKFADKCLNIEFFALLRLFELQYKLLFESIKKKGAKKFKNLRIITHGYDYAIPSSKLGFGFLRPISNAIVGNGKWLRTPLLLRGYNKREEQVSIVTGMIHHFNEMLIKVGKGYDNVYHIDSRGSVDSKKGWYNELHPKSAEFIKIAGVFEECIEAVNPTKKVFR